MTMPHMMNCSHSGEGWCIDCVKALGEERNRLYNIVDIIMRKPMIYSPYDNEADQIECPICEETSKASHIRVKRTEPIPEGYCEVFGWSRDPYRSLFPDIKHTDWCPHYKKENK